MTTAFRDKVCIVTGGASGIGRALCTELAGRGAIVAIADIDGEAARQLALQIGGTGGRAFASCVDVSQADRVQEFVDQTARQHGRIDFMFNNAGIPFSGEAHEMGLAEWDRIIDVNLRGVIHGTMAAYSLMIRQRSGHIVNMASMLGLIPMGFATAYATTKHAVVGFSTSLRAEAADLNVRVSVVCPGLVGTGLADKSGPLAAGCRRSPVMNVSRMISPEKAARVILRAVARNRAVIVFPFRAWLVWRIYRIHPRLLDRLARAPIRRYRRLRDQA